MKWVRWIVGQLFIMSRMGLYHAGAEISTDPQRLRDRALAYGRLREEHDKDRPNAR